jgi:hypothetical protein
LKKLNCTDDAGNFDLERFQAHQEDQKRLGNPPTLLWSRFMPEAVIGRGTFSCLIRAVDTFRKPHYPSVAIKVMNANFWRIGVQVCSVEME